MWEASAAGAVSAQRCRSLGREQLPGTPGCSPQHHQHCCSKAERCQPFEFFHTYTSLSLFCLWAPHSCASRSRSVRWTIGFVLPALVVPSLHVGLPVTIHLRSTTGSPWCGWRLTARCKQEQPALRFHKPAERTCPFSPYSHGALNVIIPWFAAAKIQRHL